MEINGILRKQLAGSVTDTGGAYKPKLGPKLSEDGAYLYLVAYYSDSLYRLEKYNASSVPLGADLQSLALEKSWNLPAAAGAPRDFAVSGNSAYIATSFSGVIGYDLTASSSVPDYTATAMSATKVLPFGDRVYGLYSSGMSSTVKYADRSLASVTSHSDLTAKAQSLGSASDLQAYESYIYLASAYTACFYNPTTQSFAADYSPSQTDSMTLISDAGAISGVPAYLVGNNTGYTVRIGSNNALSATALPWAAGFPATSNSAAAGNGAYGFRANSDNGDIYAFSLDGTSASVTSTDDSTAGPVGFANLSGESTNFAIRNMPEGITSGRSGAYLFALGQYPANTGTGTITGTWYIKVYRMQPGE